MLKNKRNLKTIYLPPTCTCEIVCLCLSSFLCAETPTTRRSTTTTPPTTTTPETPRGRELCRDLSANGDCTFYVCFFNTQQVCRLGDSPAFEALASVCIQSEEVQDQNQFDYRVGTFCLSCLFVYCIMKYNGETIKVDIETTTFHGFWTMHVRFVWTSDDVDDNDDKQATTITTKILITDITSCPTQINSPLFK